MSNKKSAYTEEDIETEMDSGVTKEDQVNEYYDLAAKQNYSALLDREIQLENAKAAALKHTQNTIAGAGFGTQGYGSSAQLGIENDYLRAMNEAQGDYQEGIQTNEQSRRSELLGLQEQSFQNVSALMSQTTSQDRLDELMAMYGYVDEDGNWVKPENMSNEDWNQLRYLYGLQSDAIAANTDQGYATYGSIDQLGAASYIKADGNAATLAEHYAEEIKSLWAYASRGDYSNGDAIQITNGEGDTIYLQWTSNGFRMVNKSTYDSADVKYEMKRGNSKNTTYKKVS